MQMQRIMQQEEKSLKEVLHQRVTFLASGVAPGVANQIPGVARGPWRWGALGLGDTAACMMMGMHQSGCGLRVAVTLTVAREAVVRGQEVVTPHHAPVSSCSRWFNSANGSLPCACLIAIDSTFFNFPAVSLNKQEEIHNRGSRHSDNFPSGVKAIGVEKTFDAGVQKE
ncbi:hypothetical protein AAFF_G00242210 [Aldrovandia affinis]|uniref:Uncharacterized protein n=1 Tax=Aldrovandia affinis TaxID=143900 RepID=A0AAD7WU86_9TELE|nr:hypothetical protein AAFF_G00242210 [Aldrovandia affinis]